MKKLTKKKLKKALYYSKKSGLFIWKISCGNVREGRIAGGLHPEGYIQIMIFGENYLAHRLAFLYVKGRFPKVHTDHKNRIRSDNRWKNLREATPKQNNQNRGMQKNNTSGITGVSFHSKINSWISHITIDRVRIHLGTFETKEKAVKARKEAEEKSNFYCK